MSDQEVRQGKEPRDLRLVALAVGAILLVTGCILVAISVNNQNATVGIIGYGLLASAIVALATGFVMKPPTRSPLFACHNYTNFR